MEKVPVFCLFFALSVSVVFSLNADPPCPKLESIVNKRINFYLKEAITQAAGLPRLRCHDCFVEDCHASLLLDGSASEPSGQEAPPNLSVRGKAFEIRNDVKERVDKPCHVTVSCADVTALAPRDSVVGVDGMIDPPQNSESKKNTNKWLHFAKLARFTLRGRGLIDGQGENLWVKQQRSVAAVKRLRKGRILLQPTDPKGHTGQGPHHN